MLIKFLPDLAVTAHDLLLQYFDIDWLSETEYALLYDIYYTNVGAQTMGLVFLLVIAYIAFLNGNLNINQNQELYSEDEMPIDYSTAHANIWNSLYANFRGISVILK